MEQYLGLMNLEDTINYAFHRKPEYLYYVLSPYLMRVPETTLIEFWHLVLDQIAFRITGTSILGNRLQQVSEAAIFKSSPNVFRMMLQMSSRCNSEIMELISNYYERYIDSQQDRSVEWLHKMNTWCITGCSCNDSTISVILNHPRVFDAARMKRVSLYILRSNNSSWLEQLIQHQTCGSLAMIRNAYENDIHWTKRWRNKSGQSPWAVFQGRTKVELSNIMALAVQYRDYQSYRDIASFGVPVNISLHWELTSKSSSASISRRQLKRWKQDVMQQALLSSPQASIT